MRFVVLIIILFGGCGYLFGQQLDSLLRCVLTKDAAGGGISGVYMMNKTKHYLFAFSDEKGYCFFPVELDVRVSGRDTSCYDLLEKKMKWGVYVDSSGCTPFKMNLYQWK